VDGGSRDGTVQRAGAAGGRVIQAKRGRARQLQAGVDASRGEVVLFLHADTRLPSGWGNAVCEALEDPAVSGGAFGLRFHEREISIRLVEWTARLRGAWLALPYGDQALFVRRSVLERIGGIPDVPVMEDLDLVKAIKQEGRLKLLPLDATTSARRYLEHGAVSTVARHSMALAAWRLGLDRARIVRWLDR
jgi:rSAM/selenodomain-associated transferase 2